MFLIHSTINQVPFSLFSSNRITSSRDKGPTNHLEKQSVDEQVLLSLFSVPINGQEHGRSYKLYQRSDIRPCTSE